MKISIFGIGYVGLSLGILLSQHNECIMVDICQHKVDLVNNKKSPIEDKYIIKYLSSKKLYLKATTDERYAIKSSQLIIIATPTNYDEVSKKFDTSSVESVIKNVCEYNKKSVVVIKSTVGVGFSNEMIRKFDFKNILFSPEFLREGKALFDNLHPSRIVVGVDKGNKTCISKAKKFIQLLKQGSKEKKIPSFITGLKEAESIKLFSNTYLALRVAFFNELDTFALENELNCSDIISGVCADSRIGNFYNNPSFGYGGYCLPKDTKELKANYSKIPQTLISSVIESNKVRKELIANYVINKLNDNFEGLKNQKIVGIYRLIMKSGSDNFRDAAVFDIINILLKNNLKIIIYEPGLKSENNVNNFELVEDIEEFKIKADLILCNRYDDALDSVKNKVFSRDIFHLS